MKKIINIIKKLAIRDHYRGRLSTKSEFNVYVSYIAEPFYRKWDKKYMNSHQGRKEILRLASIFKNRNINFLIENFETLTSFTGEKFDVVFGLEPNFEILAKTNPSAKKIYYATGAYWKHQNQIIKERTDAVNIKYGTDIPYIRMVKPHNSAEIADEIIQIGSKYTIETYPKELRNKITLIDQSSNDYKSMRVKEKPETHRNEFIWFGSGGSILKGVDLLLEVFSKRPDLTIHIVGPIDNEFKEQIQPLFLKYNNIHFHGFMKVNSNTFLNIVNKCTFMIYPSGSEGCPGSVINLMKLGIIPIVSRWAAFDGFEECGFILDDLTAESINRSINEALVISAEEIISRSRLCSEITTKRFTLQNYEKQMDAFFLKQHI